MSRVVQNILFMLVIAMSLPACAPEVGSKAWCKAMDEKSKMDWSARELRDYAKHCLEH